MNAAGAGARGHSLQWRIVAGLLTSLALVFIIQCVAASFVVTAAMEQFVERELVEDTVELFDELVLTESAGQLLVSFKHMDHVFRDPGSDHYFQVLVDGRRAAASPSLSNRDLNTEPLAPTKSMLGRMSGPDGLPMLFGSRGFAKDGHLVTIEIGMGLTSVDEKVRGVLWRFGLVSAFMMALLMPLQHYIVSRALRVLGQLRSDVERLANGDIQKLREDVPREVLPLVREVNSLSMALATRLYRSRHALGNLAHALKTPLAALMHSANQTPPASAGGASMLDQLGALRHRIDRELKRARLAGPGSVSSTFCLTTEMQNLLAAMRKLHDGRSLAVSADLAPDLQLRADREDILELMGNVIDNACKFARTRVHLRMTCDTGLSMEVDDNGPGCDPQFLKYLGQRGVRLDDSVEGHGLGLSIAADIVASYSGTLDFGRSNSLGGFRVRVRLPGSLIVESR